MQRKIRNRMVEFSLKKFKLSAFLLGILLLIGSDVQEFDEKASL